MTAERRNAEPDPPGERNADAEIVAVSLGCRMNACEAALMAQQARDLGGRALTVVNSCAVTAEAVRQSRQAVRRARRDRPHARLIVTGCAAALHRDAFAAMPEIDALIDNRRKRDPDLWRRALDSLGARSPEAEPRSPATPIPAIRSPGARQVRAYIPIQSGCDHACTFCVIPQTRGASVSEPLDVVIARLRRTARDYPELVLTGIDLTSWGRDLDGAPSFAELLRHALDALPPDRRLRLSSLDPAACDDSLLDVIANADRRLAPSFHLSLQAGDDLILKRMRRRHATADAVRLCEGLRQARPDCTIGADLIAGFPTEDEDAFARTCDHIERCRPTFLHVFPFSPGKGTAAARMPRFHPATARRRAARLREIGTRCFADHFRPRLGSRRLLIMESERRGRSEDYAMVEVDRDMRRGAAATVELTEIVDAEARLLRGRVIATP